MSDNADWISEDLRRAVMAKLRGGQFTAGEIAEALNLDISSVGRCLREMMRDGCVSDYAQGGLIRWRII